MTPEELTIQAFMASPQKQRMLELLGTPKKRKKLVDLLDHLKGLDDRFASRIGPGSQNVEAMTAILEDAGAPAACFVMSSDSAIDGRELPLAEALEATLDSEYGTFLICKPGQLAYFHGEEVDERYLLRRS